MWILGPYQLNPAAFQLAREGESIALPRRPFDLLVELVTRQGRVVSREELRSRVWAGTKVSEGAIDTALYEARAALGDLDRKASERWIETVRGRGFRYRGPAERSVGLEAAQDGIPFVGREFLVQELVRTVRQAIAGQGSFVLIEGAAGMGKTRLLQEISRFAAPADIATAWCEVGAPPYWPWIQLAEHLELVGDAANDETAAGRDVTQWFSQTRAGGSDETLRFDRQRRIEESLQAAGRKQPRLLFIEDLHWADAPSIALLETLAPRLATWPIAIVATTRHETEDGQRVTRMIRSSQIRRLSLRPLDNAAILKFVEPIFGRIPPADIASEILKRSEGIPLFVRELAEQIQIGPDGEFQIPAVAKTVLERRFEPLDESARLPLAVAALCGGRFDVPLVEAAVEAAAGAESEKSRGWVRDALQHGILTADARNPLQFAFAHALMRDVAESHIPSSEASLWHRRIADALAERSPDAQGATLSRLARHYAASALLEEDLERPLRFVLLAAQSAAEMLAWEDVRAHSEHVITWIPMVPHSPERDELEREARLLRCAAIAGQSGHVEETEGHLARLSELVAHPKRPCQDDRALVAAFRYSNARTQGAVAKIRDAAREVESVPGMEAIAHCWRLAAAGLSGHADEASASLGGDFRLPTSPDLRSLGRRCGWDPWVEALGLSAFACWAKGDGAEARRRSERAVEWGRQQDDQRSRIWALFLLCHLLDLLEDWEALTVRAREIEELCQRHNISPWQGFGVGMQVWAGVNQNPPREPQTQQLGDIMAAQARAAHTSFKSGILYSAARSYAFAGATEAAEEALAETEAFCERGGEKVLLPEVLRWQGLLARDRGDAARAKQKFSAAARLAQSQGATALERRAIKELEALPI